jgi:hypothetical protein
MFGMVDVTDKMMHRLPGRTKLSSPHYVRFAARMQQLGQVDTGGKTYGFEPEHHSR